MRFLEGLSEIARDLIRQIVLVAKLIGIHTGLDFTVV